MRPLATNLSISHQSRRMTPSLLLQILFLPATFGRRMLRQRHLCGPPPASWIPAIGGDSAARIMFRQ